MSITVIDYHESSGTDIIFLTATKSNIYFIKRTEYVCYGIMHTAKQLIFYTSISLDPNVYQWQYTIIWNSFFLWT